MCGMNNKFLDKVYDQIISETRIIDNKVYTPFLLFPFSPSPSSSFFFSPSSSLFPTYSFSSHCKEVYSLNYEETEYVWVKYKEGITTLINDKELV
tara:strand:- start:43 stop:327 length:285 start_codon:yes stop_codon:yes gene_type:complete